MKTQRNKFILQRKYAYINCAYMSPMLKKVEKAGRRGMAAKRRPYKITPDDFFRDRKTVRILFSKLIENKEPERIAIIPSVSYGMANVVNNLPKKKGKIIVLSAQFPSNIYPWMAEENYRLEVVEPEDGAGRGEKWNEKVLEAIDEETAAVAMGHVHWADGTKFDLETISEKAHKHDAALVVDGTQSVGAHPFSVKKIKPDALVCAGYKWLMGPYSIGAAYYGEMFDKGKPIENNWISRLHSEDFSGLVNYQEEYQPGALKYDVGEHSNFILLPMFKMALKQVLSWKPDNIQQYCSELMSEAVGDLKDLGFSIENENYRGHHLFGIRVPKGLEMEQLQKQFRRHKVSISVRGDAIRVSPHVYNDEKDVAKFMNAIRMTLE